jgi:hypothetical protein
LQQRSEIRRISRAVEYIHQNQDKPVSVEKLADMVYLRQPGKWLLTVCSLPHRLTPHNYS